MEGGAESTPKGKRSAGTSSSPVADRTLLALASRLDFHYQSWYPPVEQAFRPIESCCFSQRSKPHYCTFRATLPCWSLLWFVGITLGRATPCSLLCSWCSTSLYPKLVLGVELGRVWETGIRKTHQAGPLCKLFWAGLDLVDGCG